MNIFGHLFGHSDGALRSVSAIYNLLTILFIFLIGRNIFKNDKIALIAAFLAAIEPFYIIFSQQARFYTTCIFFGTMASYYFLQIMVNGKSSLKYYVAYTVSIILTIFSNYLTFTVFLVHGLYWLIADRTWLKLRSFMICYGIMAIPFGLWMTKGPGQYALLYIKDATNLYNSILKNPKLAASYQGFIDLASAKNLFVRGTSIVSDYFIFTNGWYEKFGNKIAFLLVIGFLLVVTFVVLQKAKKSEYQLFTFVMLIVFIPFVFSVVSAYKAGVMTGFYFRYTSFGLPFVSILMAWFLVKMFENHKILFGRLCCDVTYSVLFICQNYQAFLC
jgi:4-amino-4-deoxy-L-arabinose transferase-like glycosyltransferase